MAKQGTSVLVLLWLVYEARYKIAPFSGFNFFKARLELVFFLRSVIAK